MTLPDVLLRPDQVRILAGGTNIYIDNLAHTIKITHMGNKGDTIETVKENVERVLGLGNWDMLHNKAKKIEVDGKPDYLFTETLSF